MVAPVDPDDLDASLHNVSLGACRDPLEPKPSKAEAAGALSEDRGASSAGGRSRLASRLSEAASKAPEADVEAKQAPQRKRLPRCSFAESQVRLENALKYTALWLEAFLLYSLVWAFQPVLSEQGRKRLDDALREKYEAGRSDFSTFQKEKKRRLAERAKLGEKARLEPAGGRLLQPDKKAKDTPFSRATPRRQGN